MLVNNAVTRGTALVGTESACGPKRRLRDVCYCAAVRGKQTLGELPENDAHDPHRKSAVQVLPASSYCRLI